MSNRESDTTVRRNNGKVVINNTATQTFKEEDFVDVYEDNLTNYNNLINNIERMQDQRQEILEENEEELAAINYVLGNETPYEGEIEELEDAITEDAFQMHEQVSQINNNINQLRSQKQTLEEQLGAMSDVAVEVGEDVEEFEVKEI